MNSRGYFGVSLYQPSKIANWGGIVRSAYNFNAAFLSTIGRHYTKQASDTTDAAKHIPIFHFKNIEEWYESLPSNCFIVGLEVDAERNLETFSHPERAVYIFGGENITLPKDLWGLPRTIRVKIDTNRCLNLSSAAAIVMYDRNQKRSV